MSDRSFEFVEGATSDLSFLAKGGSLEEIFRASAEALLAATVDAGDSVGDRVRCSVSLTDSDVELLLVRFLNELIFLRDAEGLVLRPVAITIREDGELGLEADLAGEELDPARHVPACDVKAVTLHGLRVERVPDGWEAAVTLDV
jgi:SHS2 domain-containing protein